MHEALETIEALEAQYAEFGVSHGEREICILHK